ncbi:hypothetical protein CO151_13065 [bacterium CG_4_9_14_3_um_filter_65_15]|nr:MAG: hypothetical protein CO151_13065 [bacterium CG_4_9_14_3_um_filter_65_15]
MSGGNSQVFLVGISDELVRELAHRLGSDCPAILIRTVDDFPLIWSHSDGVVLMIDTREEPLSPHMPDLARRLLARGFRVIRLAHDTGGLSGVWDSRVLHLPWGVRQKVLLSAMLRQAAAEAKS